MSLVELKTVQCPYCGESIELMIDCSVSEQRYIEDCQVCCRPIDVDAVVTSSGEVFVSVFHENE